MISKYIKLITFYSYVIKLKQFLFSHIAVWYFYFCEICVLILTIYETISEQIELKNGITLDYVFGFNTHFLINQLIGFILLGFFEIAIFIIFLLIKFLLKKDFLIKSKILTNNLFYHIIWILGFYITLIISICTIIYLISISHEGILWLIDKWQT